ncbi:hypothetical protein STTU_2900 [Streptomyces sp. Tu6071]|nr:hypothetical protein STTU_2900 [Streptomyces sp. Tu6071]
MGHGVQRRDAWCAGCAECAVGGCLRGSGAGDVRARWGWGRRRAGSGRTTEHSVSTLGKRIVIESKGFLPSIGANRPSLHPQE